MKSRNRQSGVTLIELLIGLALSLIVTSSMVVLMGNSMGSATRIIHMTQLSDELRNAMSMMSRDVRRANYSAHAIYCYANADCGVGANKVTVVSEVTVNGNCMTFNVDRSQNNFNDYTDPDSHEPGGFRLTEDVNDVGSLEMWVGDGNVTCDSGSADWLALTDPDFVDINTFTVTPTLIDESIEEGGGTLNIRSNAIDLEIFGVLRLDNTISRRIVDRIRVRNDFIWRS